MEGIHIHCMGEAVGLEKRFLPFLMHRLRAFILKVFSDFEGYLGLTSFEGASPH